ncbi:MAG: DUF2281 domain-containing protein [Oscillospiraceae bacterium]|nr:DUF2281 domain-containing protein [Oscillospiraceae bacterium]
MLPIEINANSQELVRGFAEFKHSDLEILRQIVHKGSLPSEISEEIRELLKKAKNFEKQRGKPVKFGGWEDKIFISDDFNAPLDDFEEYM